MFEKIVNIFTSHQLIAYKRKLLHQKYEYQMQALDKEAKKYNYSMPDSAGVSGININSEIYKFHYKEGLSLIDDTRNLTSAKLKSDLEELENYETFEVLGNLAGIGDDYISKHKSTNDQTRPKNATSGTQE